MGYDLTPLDVTEYDLIVVGTGPVQAIIAAAAARIGKRVLHLDGNEYYGEYSTTHNLVDFGALGHLHTPEANEDALPIDPIATPAGAVILKVPAPESAALVAQKTETVEAPKCVGELMANVASFEPGFLREKDPRQCYSPTALRSAARVRSRATWETMQKLSRRYAIDLLPKLLYAQGKLVKLLIQSNISRYVEFKAVHGTYMMKEGGIREVPCSKKTLMQDSAISLIDKRRLMKFLQYCGSAVTAEEEAAAAEQLFGEAMSKRFKLNPDAQQFIWHAIAGVPPTATLLEGLEATRRFLTSIGRYGPSPFLSVMYGCGELSQAFCRLCAVYGGMYVLRRPLQALLVRTSGDNAADGVVGPSSTCCVGVVAANQSLQATWTIAPANLLPAEWSVESVTRTVVLRAVIIVEGSVSLGHSQCDVADVITFAPGEAGNTSTVRALVQTAATEACPQGQSVIHLTGFGAVGTSPQDELQGVAAALLAAGGARTLWTSFFSLESRTVSSPAHGSMPSGVVVCSAGGDSAVGFDAAVAEAREIFQLILPGEEFLPMAPNPEDLVWESEDVGTAEDDPLAPMTTVFGTQYYRLAAYHPTPETDTLALDPGCADLAPEPLAGVQEPGKSEGTGATPQQPPGQQPNLTAETSAVGDQSEA